MNKRRMIEKKKVLKTVSHYKNLRKQQNRVKYTNVFIVMALWCHFISL